MIFDSNSLRSWFSAEKRDLPWRKAATPYSVLISEIMLQQTQVAVVIPYYLRWMERYPTFKALAMSLEEEVLKLWEGLGYYSRAKNLRKAAQLICQKWNGAMPENELMEIPGVGPYTAGAIRAFAFKQKAAAVDGNVMRVLSRYFALHDDISLGKTQKNLRQLAENILPDYEPWVVAEGLIELGALVCKKIPLCAQCPLKSSCQAYEKGLTAQLPIKTGQVAATKLFRIVPIIRHKGRLLIRQVPKGEIMAGLHEFPYFDVEDRPIEKRIEAKFGLKATPIQKFPTVRHSFTKYRAELTPILLECSNQVHADGYFWASQAELMELPFSSGHRRILKFIMQLP